MAFHCEPCETSFSRKDGYRRHCRMNRVHALVISGTPLDEARRLVMAETNERISISNTEHAKTHENPRKGVNLTEEQRIACRERATKGKPRLTETHPDIATEWHPEKNESNAPDMFTANSDFPAWWLCPHSTCGCPHEYLATVGNRTRGSGCPFCSRKKCLCVHQSIVTTHPSIAAEFHPTKNGELKASDIMYGSSTPVWWLCARTCPEGCVHEYLASTYNRCGPQRQNCPFCCNQQLCKHTSIAYTYPEISAEWHPTRNGDDLPSQYSKGSNYKAWWQCRTDSSHVWQAVIRNRCTNGSGCPDCKRKTQRIMGTYLRSLFESVVSEDKTIVPEKFMDFVIHELQLIIELDGLQHFRDIPYWRSVCSVVQDNDVYKMKHAVSRGYRVIRISQQDVFDNPTPEWLDVHLRPHLTCDGDPIVYICPSNPSAYDAHKSLYAERL